MRNRAPTTHRETINTKPSQVATVPLDPFVIERNSSRPQGVGFDLPYIRGTSDLRPNTKPNISKYLLLYIC